VSGPKSDAYMQCLFPAYIMADDPTPHGTVGKKQIKGPPSSHSLAVS